MPILLEIMGSRVTIVARHLFVLFTTLTLVGCSSEPDPKAEPVVRPVKVIEISASTDTHQVRLPAIVEAGTTADLSFKTVGRLEVFDVKSGQDVVQGDIIGQLDQSGALDAVKTAEIRYSTAKTEYTRAEQLIDKQAIATTVYDQRKAELDVAKTALATARRILTETTLLAPFDGVIAIVHVEKFQNIQGGEPIVTLQSIGSAKAVARVPASLVSQSEQIEPIEITVSLDAVLGLELPATLGSTDAIAESDSQAFRVEFDFTAPGDVIILPGMTGTVFATYRLKDPKMAYPKVPLTSIQADNRGRYVWLVDPATMTVSRRDITLAEGVGSNISVLEGLSTGDLIAGAGVSYLYEGMQIKRYDPKRQQP